MWGWVYILLSLHGERRVPGTKGPKIFWGEGVVFWYRYHFRSNRKFLFLVVTVILLQNNMLSCLYCNLLL